MKRFASTLLLGVLPWLSLAQAAAPAPATAPAPRIAVTDLAYTRDVEQYVEAALVKRQSALNASPQSLSMTDKSEVTYVAGSYSYVEQRELMAIVNDIKGSLLKSTSFRLVQAKRFDAGTPQPTKAEQVLDQMKTGKVAKPVRQPQVHDIVERVRKGEFNGADYVLFGTLSSLQFRDTVSALQGTANASHVFSLDLVADFSLINTKTFEVKAAFSAQGAGSDIKLLSARPELLPPNRGKVIRETSRSLAANVYEQLAEQLNVGDEALAARLREAEPADAEPAPGHRAAPSQGPVTILH